MRQRSAHAVYSVFFEPKGPKCFIGHSGSVHLQLLERHHLSEAFEKSPQDFIMGRFRLYANGEFLVDVYSDLWRSKCGNASPLEHITPDRRRSFEICLMRTFTDTVYLIDMGSSFRAPVINYTKLQLLLNHPGESLYVLRHAATR